MKATYIATFATMRGSYNKVLQHISTDTKSSFIPDNRERIQTLIRSMHIPASDFARAENGFISKHIAKMD